MLQNSVDITEGNFRQTLSLASKLQEMGDYDKAKLYYEKLYEFKKNVPELLAGYGSVLLQIGKAEDGIVFLEQALKIKPNQPGPLSNLSVGYLKQNKIEMALKSADSAIKIDPNFAEAYAAKANSLVRLERLSEALESYTKAIQIKPEASNFYNLRGVAFQNSNRLEDALSDYNKAIALKPDNASAYFNKGYLKLLLGDFVAGWRLFEWRWKGYAKKYFRNYPQKLWTGEPLAGKSIFIHAEQGFGDFIQHFRYVIEVMKCEPQHLFLEVPDGLASLVALVSPKIEIIKKKQTLPKFDYYCPIMSLPYAFKTRLDTIPNSIPYFTLKKNNLNEAEQKVSQGKMPKVGLVWSGSANVEIDFAYWRRRSISLGKLEKLLSLPIEFHSLQKELPESDIRILEKYPRVINHLENIKDFKDTAELIADMDLIITIDTSVAHLAGALGIKVWILLPFIPDYRWLLNRSDSPWYPSATLFRQSKPGDWDAVIESVLERIKREFLIEK